VDAETLLRKLANGGRIVSSNDLTECAIADASACGRMHVDERGFGYVYLPDSPMRRTGTFVLRTGGDVHVGLQSDGSFTCVAALQLAGSKVVRIAGHVEDEYPGCVEWEDDREECYRTFDCNAGDHSDCCPVKHRDA